MMTDGFPVEVAVQRICGQHRNVARVLRAQQGHLQAIQGHACRPDFLLIAAAIRYIDMFAHGIHHPSEETYLIPAMRQNGAPADVLDNVIGAHSVGAKQFATLQGVFEQWRDKPEMRNPPFLQLVPDYIAFEFDHISYEETIVLPCAVDTLPAADWERIAEAFRSHDDPLFGLHPVPELSPLHCLLVPGRVAH
jgi:hemerythrin-like domain-containing protein